MITILNAGQNYRIVGGSDRYLLALEGVLKGHGHEVIPFAAVHPDNHVGKWNDWFPPSVDFSHPGPSDIARYLYSFPARKAIDSLIRERRPDVAHLHIYYGQLSTSILGPLRRAGIPIVQTLHEYKTVCPTYSLFANGGVCEACQGKHYWQAIAHRCNRGSLARSALSAAEAYVSRWGGAQSLDHYIAVSDFLRDKVIALGMPAERVTTVHNFVDCRGTRPAEALGEYFLFFGRLEKIKGIFTLLEAAAPLRDIPLLIVGDGGERERISAWIEERGLSHIKMLGFKTGHDLEGLIRGSLCTISPSVCYETFGLTLVESFVHGRPVVASRIGGMTEVVADGEDGWLFPPGDALALRERLLWMMQNREAAREMGLQGRLKVEKRFDPESHYAKIMDVYRKVGVS